MLFTHFGVSGPLVLDLSNKIIYLLEEYQQVHLSIDLKSGLKPEQVENRLLNEFRTKGNSELKNVLKNLLLRKLIPVFITLLSLGPGKKANQITQQERYLMMNLLKALPLTINGCASSGGYNLQQAFSTGYLAGEQAGLCVK